MCFFLSFLFIYFTADDYYGKSLVETDFSRLLECSKLFVS